MAMSRSIFVTVNFFKNDFDVISVISVQKEE